MLREGRKWDSSDTHCEEALEQVRERQAGHAEEGEEAGDSDQPRALQQVSTERISERHECEVDSCGAVQVSSG
jgi:hypothetical protein